MQSLVEADAVILVDDVIPLFQVAERAQEVSLPGGADAPSRYFLSEKLLLADDGQVQVGKEKTPAQSAFPQAQFAGSRETQGFVEQRAFRQSDGQLIVFQEVAHPLQAFPAGAEKRHQHSRLQPGPDPLDQRGKQGVFASGTPLEVAESRIRLQGKEKGFSFGRKGIGFPFGKKFRPSVKGQSLQNHPLKTAHLF
ncbi:MAG: hypothetical protein A4E72_00678 [Syntrophus sp. PtaU1.Bin208]|nr:MAG: hypothetical protein A4E72_00678 [Syntrophus sp. PtaU1.Bin208]